MVASHFSRVGAQEIDDIRNAFQLSDGELGTLFGVSRPAVQQWRLRGVPPMRAADVDRVRELSAYFTHRFLPQRVPQIVRTPGKGLAGKTVLETIAERGVDPVYAYLEHLFSYTPK